MRKSYSTQLRLDSPPIHQIELNYTSGSNQKTASRFVRHRDKYSLSDREFAHSRRSAKDPSDVLGTRSRRRGSWLAAASASVETSEATGSRNRPHRRKKVAELCETHEGAIPRTPVKSRDDYAASA